MRKITNYGLMAILLGALLLRIVYWSKGLLGGDSIGYAIGGLGTWCAHPPGYFGFCFMGWLLNQVIANINDSLILINVIMSLLGIYFCHRLAESFGLRGRDALLATAAYAFSINLDYFSVLALSNAPEGMFATLLALVCHRAIQNQSFRLSLLATCIWALSGAFRQTSIAFLAPLWIYTLWASGPLKRMPIYLLLAIPLIMLWSRPNAYYMAAYSGDLNTKISAGGWQYQAYMASNHDQSKLGLDENATTEAVGAYHWPFIEVLQWVDEKTGGHFMPDYRQYNAPPPSLEKAAKLTGLQLVKLTYCLLFSLPVLLLAPGLLTRLKDFKNCFSDGELPFFTVWMAPVGMFYVVGHCGSLAYLQIFLSGISVLVVMLFSRAWPAVKSGRWQRWQVAHVSLTTLGLSFFLFARPFQSGDTREKLLDVIALQYTGQGIKNRYSVARSNTNLPGPAVMPEWIKLETDAEIVRYFETLPHSKVCLIKPRAVR